LEFALSFFFKYLEAIRAVHPVVPAAPAVARAIVARQNGHIIKLLLSSIPRSDMSCRCPIETSNEDQNVS
jgi:hypothetical protein